MTNQQPDRILLRHGAGGRAMVELIENVFLSSFGSSEAPADDSALLQPESSDLVFTTDSFVVDPIFFPGADIGRLAVAGTVNDILTAAARPIALSASFIIEEGFEMDSLKRIAGSMRAAADECSVKIVTGDTKVVPKGSADKLFITTTGVGVRLLKGVSGSAAAPGDRVILTGSVGDHGTAVMLAREKLLDGGSIASDAAPLADIVLNLIESGCEIHAMRDPTRGGIAACLNEIARQSGVSIEIEEKAIPIKDSVRAACEALGLDPFQVANEGKMLIFVPESQAESALSTIRQSKYGEQADIIGVVGAAPGGRVQARTELGTCRILDMPQGELLPRIC